MTDLPFVTLEELAEKLRVTLDTAKGYCREKGMPYRKISEQVWIVPLSELELWVDGLSETRRNMEGKVPPEGGETGNIRRRNRKRSGKAKGDVPKWGTRTAKGTHA